MITLNSQTIKKNINLHKDLEYKKHKNNGFQFWNNIDKII